MTDIKKVQGKLTELRKELEQANRDDTSVPHDLFQNALKSVSDLEGAIDQATRPEDMWVATIRIAFKSPASGRPIRDHDDAAHVVNEVLMQKLYDEGWLLAWGYDKDEQGRYAYPSFRQMPKDGDGYIEEEEALGYKGDLGAPRYVHPGEED